MSEDAKIEPRNVSILSHTQLDLIHTRLDHVHTRLDHIHTRLDHIHTGLGSHLQSRLDLIHTGLDHIYTRLEHIQTRLDHIHTRRDHIHTRLDHIHTGLDLIHTHALDNEMLYSWVRYVWCPVLANWLLNAQPCTGWHLQTKTGVILSQNSQPTMLPNSRKLSKTVSKFYVLYLLRSLL